MTILVSHFPDWMRIFHKRIYHSQCERVESDACVALYHDLKDILIRIEDNL